MGHFLCHAKFFFFFFLLFALYVYLAAGWGENDEDGTFYMSCEDFFSPFALHHACPAGWWGWGWGLMQMMGHFTCHAKMFFLHFLDLHALLCVSST